MRHPSRWPAPRLFGLLILPLGIVVVGFNFTALPFLFAEAGVPVDRIASISSIINLPGVIGFLVAPLVDIKLRRKDLVDSRDLWHCTFRLPVFPTNRHFAFDSDDGTHPRWRSHYFPGVCSLRRTHREDAIEIGSVQSGRLVSGALIAGNGDRRLTYAAAGLTNALAALVLLVGKHPSVYLAGPAAYLVTIAIESRRVHILKNLKIALPGTVTTQMRFSRSP